MKRPFGKAIGAFLPLIVLLALAMFSRPIRDWFLHSPHKKGETETSPTSASDVVGHIRLVRSGTELE